MTFKCIFHSKKWIKVRMYIDMTKLKWYLFSIENDFGNVFYNNNQNNSMRRS